VVCVTFSADRELDRRPGLGLELQSDLCAVLILLADLLGCAIKSSLESSRRLILKNLVPTGMHTDPSKIAILKTIPSSLPLLEG
jgi:hypothetical protein